VSANLKHRIAARREHYPHCVTEMQRRFRLMRSFD
jgi:hypothetical protein